MMQFSSNVHKFWKQNRKLFYFNLIATSTYCLTFPYSEKTLLRLWLHGTRWHTAHRGCRQQPSRNSKKQYQQGEYILFFCSAKGIYWRERGYLTITELKLISPGWGSFHHCLRIALSLAEGFGIWKLPGILTRPGLMTLTHQRLLIPILMNSSSEGWGQQCHNLFDKYIFPLHQIISQNRYFFKVIQERNLQQFRSRQWWRGA